MILIKNCFYIHSPETPDGGRGWDILLRGPQIAKIASEITVEEVESMAISDSVSGEATGSDGALEIIDGSRHVVVPGFINTHHHFYQTLTRNIPDAQNAKLFDWLVYHYEVWKYVNDESVRISTMLATGELLKTGCTTTTDHHYLYPHGFEGDLMALQFESARRLGIRFSPSRGSMSLSKKDGGLPPDSVVQTEEEILADSERVIGRFHDTSDFSMSKVTLAPCSPFSVTPQLMQDTVKLARTEGVKLHTHLAETLDEEDYTLRYFKKRPLAVMEDWGFIGPDVYYAHGIHFNDEELRRLAETKTGVSHCPSSNMRLGSGIARVAEMRKAGIPLSIGVDGSASNDTSDFLGEMRNALLLQRVRYGSDSIGARDIVDMATLGGAHILGYERVGSLQTGWAADLAMFDVFRFDYAGALSDPLAALLFAGDSHQTAYTIVNGKVVVRKGELVGYDEEKLFVEGNGAAERLLKLAGE